MTNENTSGTDIVNWTAVENFYHEALLAGGFLGDGTGTSFRVDCGLTYERYEYTALDGMLKLVDEWATSGEGSFGRTQIFWAQPGGGWKLIWMMPYHGKYTQKAIAFLRHVLRDAYMKRTSICGRGPELRTGQEDITYCNEVHGKQCNDFRACAGRESIVDGDGTILGFHEYACVALV